MFVSCLYYVCIMFVSCLYYVCIMFVLCLYFQLDALKRTVDRTVTDLESTRSHVTQLKKDVVDKENR